MIPLKARCDELVAAFIEGTKSTAGDREVALRNFRDVLDHLKRLPPESPLVVAQWHFVADSDAFEVIAENLSTRLHFAFALHITFLGLFVDIMEAPVDFSNNSKLTNYLRDSQIGRNILDENFQLGKHLATKRSALAHKRARDIEDLKMAPICSRLTLRALGRLFRMFRRDPVFWGSFDRDDLLFFNFTLLLSSIPEKDGDSDPAALSHNELVDCMTIFASDLSPTTLPSVSATRVVDLIGATKIAKRCLELLEDDDITYRDQLAGLSYTIIRLLDDNRLYEAFLAPSNVYAAVLQKFWRLLPQFESLERLSPSRGLKPSYSLVSTAFLILATSFRRAETDLQMRAVLDLIRNNDLILYLGKYILIGSDTVKEFSDDSKFFLKIIEIHCKDRLELMAKHVVPPWLHVLRGLEALQKASAVDPSSVKYIGLCHAVNTWLEFGQNLVIDNTEYVQDGVDGPITGCSWFKCPMHENPEEGKLGRTMLRCSRCKTQYCSFPCQRRDWGEGSHRKQCRGSAT